MSDTDFKPGDEVQLKVGGPPMVVMQVADYGPVGPNPGVQCEWLDDKKKRQEDVFAATSLRRYTRPTGSVGIVRG